MELRSQLIQLAEPAYRDFAASLIPNVRPMLGVRLPQLRKLARQVAAGDWQTHLQESPEDYFEEVMIKGLAIAYAQAPGPVIAAALEEFLPKVNDWSVCDSVCATLRIARREPELFLATALRWSQSRQEFSQRMGLVLMLDHFLLPSTIHQVLEACCSLRPVGQYDRMAAGWCLATAWPLFPQLVEPLLAPGQLEEPIRRMALRKLLDSRRVPAPDKTRFRTLLSQKEESSCPF
ncbi:MAG: DNA alkylation repair protein [Eubacteriales bacterium]|jgi:3-methyladenine DNA glycosylase AlkD